MRSLRQGAQPSHTLELHNLGNERDFCNASRDTPEVSRPENLRLPVPRIKGIGDHR